MGKVKILEDTQIPSLPCDFFVCNYKRKPNYLSSKIARANWQASSYRFGTGSKISTEVFPKDICKVSSFLCHYFFIFFYLLEFGNFLSKWERGFKSHKLTTKMTRSKNWVRVPSGVCPLRSFSKLPSYSDSVRQHQHIVLESFVDAIP